MGHVPGHRALQAHVLVPPQQHRVVGAAGVLVGQVHAADHRDLAVDDPVLLVEPLVGGRPVLEVQLVEDLQVEGLEALDLDAGVLEVQVHELGLDVLEVGVGVDDHLDVQLRVVVLAPHERIGEGPAGAVGLPDQGLHIDRALRSPQQVQALLERRLAIGQELDPVAFAGRRRAQRLAGLRGVRGCQAELVDGVPHHREVAGAPQEPQGQQSAHGDPVAGAGGHFPPMKVVLRGRHRIGDPAVSAPLVGCDLGLGAMPPAPKAEEDPRSDHSPFSRSSAASMILPSRYPPSSRAFARSGSTWDRSPSAAMARAA